ncbi:MAG: AAA family ATPase [Patescibacteria group bacterium]
MVKRKGYTLTWPIIGHRENIKYLSQCVSTQNVVPAYLFHGPLHLGKTATAQTFIQMLLCTNEERRPCGACENCQKLINRSHPDVAFLEKEVDKKNISIDDIREKIIHRLQLSSFFNSYKVALINGAEYLSTDAANSLLKTLEEPTKNTLIILIANRLENLPRTVISRCQLIEFRPVSTDDVLTFIQKEQPTIDRTSALAIARLSAGRPGLAWQYLHIPELLEERKAQVNDFLSYLQADLPSKFSYIGELTAGPSYQESVDSVSVTIGIWQNVLRDIILLHYQLMPFTVNYFTRDSLEQAKKKYTPKVLGDFVKQLQLIQKSLRFNINPRLALENFFLQL